MPTITNIFFHVDTEDEMREWVEAIEFVIGQREVTRCIFFFPFYVAVVIVLVVNESHGSL